MKLRTIAFLTVALAAAAAFAQQQTATLSGFATVIDGDTLRIGAQRIRLFGIDSPETDQTCRDDTGNRWFCGTVATFALIAEINGNRVSCEEKDRDRYGRIVAICFAGDRDIGQAMVRRGWAIDYTRYSHGLYAADQKAAADAKLGIWKGSFDQPEYWRRTHRERR